ncbi:DoxX-like family protein [Candidatus Peregrinibacteria bacterium CG10_big_fil_rev_8_21_14_0_10_49_24]|nr:MAG: DoxX-like family protein [Candidatus Peregrinibacteria bacterium CG11_big_fil_rev_8_21_14_0_20_49_14]PIR50711.1 MAG: DoxX-like family protein [Candidatus Peregrinibacteria bacterium CG10_big_fil_rev_8_21_14_0_10_49_24]PJA68245.1 MAG: DoxX-like family protein [Candidatus Peregrinibacteria bacterium CG_4_9_14_3_um_filter_49_12]
MKKKLLYWIPTGLLLFAMVGSAVQYFTDIPGTSEAFNQLGYPAYVLYFNGAAKILGAIAIVAPVSKVLKEWAYAGYLYILLLALQALYVNMPLQLASVMLVFVGLWALSYWRYRTDYAK